jgi:hypothetical protein
MKLDVAGLQRQRVGDERFGFVELPDTRLDHAEEMQGV